MEKIYNLNIFEAEVHLKLMVTASNPKHATERIGELLKSRITQYIHPEDDQPKFKVIGLVITSYLPHEPYRKVFHEGNSEGSTKYDETQG